MTKSLRIVQMIDDLEIGGAEKLVVSLARQAGAVGLDLTVASLNSAFDQVILDELKACGVTYAFFPAAHLLDLKRLVRLTRYLRRGGFDLVQCHLGYANIVGVLAARAAGLPVIGTLHSTGNLADYPHPAILWLEGQILRHLAQRIIAVGQTVAEAFRPRLAPREIQIIVNPASPPVSLTPEQRRAVRQEMGCDDSCPMLISVGRFAPPKGYHDLMEALSLLQQTHPNFVMLMAGDGPLFDEIRQAALQKGLEGQIRFLGFRDDVPLLLAASDIFVSSSHWEGLPLAVLEAMQAGLPVVATAVGDIPHIVAQDAGLIVPPHAPPRLAEAIASLLDSPSRRTEMGRAAQARVRQEYSAEAWIQKMMHLYTEVLSEEGRTR
jgi:glycosyltransferase involved in cell wall biosynthesis